MLCDLIIFGNIRYITYHDDSTNGKHMYIERQCIRRLVSCIQAYTSTVQVQYTCIFYDCIFNTFHWSCLLYSLHVSYIHVHLVGQFTVQTQVLVSSPYLLRSSVTILPSGVRNETPSTSSTSVIRESSLSEPGVRYLL